IRRNSGSEAWIKVGGLWQSMCLDWQLKNEKLFVQFDARQFLMEVNFFYAENKNPTLHDQPIPQVGKAAHGQSIRSFNFYKENYNMLSTNNKFRMMSVLVILAMLLSFANIRPAAAQDPIPPP